MPAAAWMGASATVSCIVEQLGFATMPRCALSASGLTSLTTSGTSSSRRQREELSITTAPASTNRGGPRVRDRCAGGEERDVEARDRIAVEGLHGECPAVPVRDRCAGGATRGERHDLAGREGARAELLEHQRPDLARRPDDGDAEGIGHPLQRSRCGLGDGGNVPFVTNHCAQDYFAPRLKFAMRLFAQAMLLRLTCFC